MKATAGKIQRSSVDSLKLDPWARMKLEQLQTVHTTLLESENPNIKMLKKSLRSTIMTAEGGAKKTRTREDLQRVHSKKELLEWVEQKILRLHQV